MAKSKFIRLVSSLSPASLRALKSYLNSPMVNKNATMVEFFNLLLKAKDPDSPAKKEKIFTLVWPDRKFTANKFDQYKTQLTKLILDFLAFKNFQTQPKKQLVNRMDELLGLSLDIDFHATRQELSKLMADETSWSGSDFLVAYESTYQFSDLLVRQAWRGPIPLWEEGYTHLVHYYLVQKLKLACAVRNQAHIFQTELPAWVNDPDVLAPVAKGNEPVLIALYRHIHFSLIQPDNPEHYENLSAGLTEYGKKLAPQEVMDLYLHAFNHCIRRLRQGGQGPKQEMKRLYEEMQSGDKVLINGKLPSPLIKNLFMILYNVDREEAEQFLNEMDGEIKDVEKQSTIHYCKAIMAFSKGEIREASRRIRLVMDDGKDIFYKLDARVLQMCCWFLLEEWSLLESEYEALRNQLIRPRKNKFSDVHLKHYYRFNHFLHRLTMIVQEPGGEKKTKKFDRLTEEIKTEPRQIPMKGWLLGQIANSK